MHLKLDNLITKNENGIKIQIYSCIIAYLILQLIDIASSAEVCVEKKAGDDDH